MNRYEERRWKLQTLDNTSKEDSKGLCVSYFCPENPDWETFPKEWVKDYKEGRPRKPVTRVEFKPPESDFTILYDLDKAINQMTDKVFTSKLTRGRRVTTRKEFLDMKPYEQYDYIALMEYLRQCKREGGYNKCLLSKKEWGMIQPKLTKKQERDKRLSKNLMMY
ncbi:hypothetical protein VPHK460_0251 [Vibrio phage K460]